MNGNAPVLQSVHHLAAVATHIIQLEFSYHKSSISWEILPELHATTERNTQSCSELILDEGVY